MAVAFLAPLAFSAKLDGDAPQAALAVVETPKMTLAVVGKQSDEVDNPKMTLAVVGKHEHAQEVAALESQFARSEEVHQKAMETISQDLTVPKAIEVLQHSSVINASSLKEVSTLLSGSQNLRALKRDIDDGFGGLDGARKMLNDMIHESMSKYDGEIAKCVSYYSKQCALMETARGQISAANQMAASSKNLILDAQGTINKATKDIPATTLELKGHNAKCTEEIKKLNARLKLVMGDIAIMTMILEMTDCDKKLLQMDKLSMLRCHNDCTKKDSIKFNHNHLQQEVEQLHSKRSQDLLSETFADLFNSDDSEEASMKLVQVVGSEYMSVVNVTEMVQVGQKPKKMKKNKTVKAPFNNPPVPQTKVPANPCTDPNGGAPGAASKRAAKCTLKKSPQCYKLQGRFLQIQAGIADDRDQLMEDIDSLEGSCKETRETLEASIENDNNMLSNAQTKLAGATEKEASAGETGRQVSKENDQYDGDLKKQMKTCTANYVSFEQELCALRKIRGDLYKKMVKGHKGFFQDCEVSKWTPEACSKKCAGGDQKLIRNVMTKSQGGAKCLPLKAQKRCNQGPCPVNCKLASWSGWSKCSSKCGGGISQRVRDIKVPMQYNGNPCGSTSETKQCAVEACEKPCELSRWTKWTGCSKDCDGGSKKRQRTIKVPAQGSGTCAGEWSQDRLQYMPCNTKSCKTTDPNAAIKCNQALDVVLLLDGTPKSGKAGWAAEVKAANLFVDAFTGKGKSGPNFAVIHYTGPRTWSGVSRCTGSSTKKVNIPKDCRVKIAQHFTQNMPKVKNIINGLQFAPGSKLLSLAMMTSMAEMALGRPTARTVVVVFIDGEPLSYRKTLLAARTIRKKARLVFVAVVKFSPLKALKKWASRRWQENIVPVDSPAQLAKAETGTHLVANICPNAFPKLKVKRKKTR